MVIQKSTYKDQVVEHIYDLVLDGKYRAGDQLKESHLAAELGISRAPVREALKELIANGVVEYKPQVGSFISQLSSKQIVDAYITRGVLEGYAISSTCELFNEDDYEELEDLVAKMRKAGERGNRKRVVEVGGFFHDFLVSKNKNIQLSEYAGRLSLKLHVLFYKHWGSLYDPDEIADRHQEIVASLIAKNLTDIEQTVRTHYMETGTKIAAFYQQSETLAKGGLKE